MKTTNIQEAFKAIKTDGRLFCRKESSTSMLYSVNSDGAMCISNLSEFGGTRVLGEPIPIANKPRDYGIETFTVEQIISDWVVLTRAEIDAIDREEYLKQK